MESKWVLLRRWLISFTNRALRRLGFFPFTLFYVLLNAAIKVVQLRRGRIVVCVGEVTGETTSLPRSVMLWLDRVLTGPPGYQFDVCLRLPPEAADANLQEVFSVLLTSPRLRSVGLYWDASSVADDLPLLQAKQDRSDPPVRATSHEDLGSPNVKQLQEFFQADHVGIVLPVAATRDAQTLLKRQAGGGFVVCLNVPPELASLADAVARARPDIWFFDLAHPASPTTAAANHQSIAGQGFSLHERMALVQAADAYVGSFDALGCAALVSGRTRGSAWWW